MEEQTCPVTGHTMSRMEKQPTTNKDWWPDKINLDILRQNCAKGNPMSKGFNYAEEFEKLDLKEVKRDIFRLIKDSKDWWPADYGTYAPFFIRMAWHSAGTYRVSDGRGGGGRGTQRFAPINSWPDNANLDKARRLLWPVKQKYGNRLSWADLLILAGNCALESMGLKTIGFGGGREDVWQPQIDVDWGSEKEWLTSNRSSEPGQIDNGLAAVEMGLIYVNPQGPGGNPDPVLSAKNIRITFRRMAMNDEETVALVAGGHTFGKCHGAASAKYLGPAPEAAPIAEQGLGWKNSYGTGNADDTITSGIEGAWKPNPQTWDMGYLETLFKYDWELVKSPAGAYQWLALDVSEEDMIEDAHDKNKKHRPMMTTADLGLRYDPIYQEIALDYLKNPEKFEKAFADAWFKLTHRDMGPISRYLGSEVPKQQFIWQDPVPVRNYRLIDKNDISLLKKMILNTDLSVSELVKTAWASASTFRGSDKRGGANGARIMLKPQNSWQVNEPECISYILTTLKNIQNSYNRNYKPKQVSMADLIILAGNAGVEQAIRNAGYNIEVPFLPGRTDATQEMTDIESFKVLEPKADAFRNYIMDGITSSPEEMMIDKAQLLTLDPPEMTVLIGGMRVLRANYNDTLYGVFTDKKNVLSNDYFVNLLDMDTVWEPISRKHDKFVGRDRKTGDEKWTATRVDLIFGSDSQLRALAEVYASKGNEKKFIMDFILAWNKVMNADRFDVDKDNT